MKASKSVRRVQRHHARLRGRHDLNMVPMIDMMVILVFFLIFTAVFSKTNVLELNLPSSTAGVPDLPEGLQLEVIVRDGSIDVADRATGVLQSLPNTATGYDLVRARQLPGAREGQVSGQPGGHHPDGAGHLLRRAGAGDGHGPGSRPSGLAGAGGRRWRGPDTG